MGNAKQAPQSDRPIPSVRDQSSTQTHLATAEHKKHAGKWQIPVLERDMYKWQICEFKRDCMSWRREDLKFARRRGSCEG